MRINTKEVIKNYEGKDLTVKEKNDAGVEVDVPYTVRDAISIAINSQVRDEVITAEQKNKIYGISIKLYQNSEIDLTVDDRAFIKERAGKIHNSLVYGRLCEALEEKAKTEPSVA